MNLTYVQDMTFFHQRTMTSSNLLAIHKSKDIELLHFSTDVSTLEEAYYIRIAK